PMRKYYYIDIPKTWHDAQTYCRENYEELAIFYSMEDIQLLSKPQPFSSAYSWIGLSDDTRNWKPHMGNASNSWIWTATGKPSRTGFEHFNKPAQPNRYAPDEVCCIMDAGGTWSDLVCSSTRNFLCFNDTESGVIYTYINSTLQWSDALAYCRQYHTDLVMIEDTQTDREVFNSKPAVVIWIGLVRVPWVWPDGSPLIQSNWQTGHPTAGVGVYCVTEDDTHKWFSVGCTNLYPFICHRGKYRYFTFTFTYTLV
ncbi:hypothetical protein NL108_015487, partial [Boleophthalmus pectinirostris]